MPRQLRPDAVGLPPRPFLYTLDQISAIIAVPIQRIQTTYVYFENRSIGVKSRDLLSARNIAPANERPDWRVSEQELVRWMRFMGFQYYDRGYYA